MLEGIEVFAAVVEENGFTAAARRLGKSVSFVSKEVGLLEERLGVRLLSRTTRQVSLTEDGQIYYDECRRIISAADSAARTLAESRTHPRGQLRISAPVSFSLSHLTKILPAFMAAHPDVSVDLEMSDGIADIVDRGFDIALRYGHLEDSSLVARQLAVFPGVTVAAPEYWDQHGRPQHPKDLAGCDGICFSPMRPPSRWAYTSTSGKAIVVDVNPKAICNSAEMELALARAGLGVTRLPGFMCMDAIANGTVEAVLTEFHGEPRGLYAVYAHRAHMPAKTRAFIDHVVHAMGTRQR
ncbi:MAG: LysR family transcriptional regulator [Hyphomicrobiaceae bacterium]